MRSVHSIAIKFMYLAAFLLIVAIAIGAVFLRDLSIARALLLGRRQMISTPFGESAVAAVMSASGRRFEALK
jgi:hypothetical protein